MATFFTKLRSYPFLGKFTQTQFPQPDIMQQTSGFASGFFLDGFLMKAKKNKDLIVNRKIWSRRSSIWPEFVDTTVRIYNGKNFVKCKITEGKVGHKFGEFAFTRKRRPMKTNNAPAKKKAKK